MVYWYNHLYVGKKAKRKRYKIIQSIREGRFDPCTYVITPPQNGNNVLDIYPAAMLLQPHYQAQELLILGIADNYWEALEVVRNMVDDLYQKTGDFQWSDWMKENG